MQLSPAAGMNVDRWGRTHLPTLQGLYVPDTRLVLCREDPDTHQALDVAANVARFVAAGIQVTGVFVRESLVYQGQEQSWLQAAFAYRDLGVIEQLSRIQIWNEADGPHGGSSATLSMKRLNALSAMVIPLFTDANPHLQVCAAGISTGQPDAWDGFDWTLYHEAGVHQYDMEVRDDDESGGVWPYRGWGHAIADDALALLATKTHGRPLVITEWGTTNPAYQAEYIERTMALYHRLGLTAHYFAYSDQFMPTPFGLFTEDGEAKPAYLSFRDTAHMLALPGGGDAPSPPPVPAPDPGAPGEGDPDMATLQEKLIKNAQEAWQARWRAIAGPKAVYIHHHGIPFHWRKNFATWGYPLLEAEIKLTDPVDGKEYDGMIFEKVGPVIWKPSGPKLLGWPDPELQ